MRDSRTMGQQLAPMDNPAGGTPTTHWRWYHFYFVLALFDLVIIAISLYQYHHMLGSYSVALTDMGNIDDKQTWVSNLRLAVVQLNAPGNDVFESRRVQAERERFERTHVRYHALFDRASEFGTNLSEFSDHMEGMIRDEERIFEMLGHIAVDGLTGDDEQRTLADAIAIMPSMDRFQADALETLAVLAESMTNEERRLADSYGAFLARSAAGEKYLLGTVVLILIGVFWYGRKLHETHEKLITEQQHAIEEKLARLAAVGEVCSAVAHGIRNPLAAITSSAQLALQYGTLDESTKLRVQDILDEGYRLNQRIAKLLDFAGATQTRLEHCDLSQVVRDAVREIQPKLDEGGIEVNTVCGDEPIIVEGDREWLAQAIIEVVSNSMDHLPSGGRVDISCMRDADQRNLARIDVIDDGPGIPESVRPQVFDLFFTSKADGNGIGLASVKRVIDMHGGQVTAATHDGPGAHIEILLPIA